VFQDGVDQFAFAHVHLQLLNETPKICRRCPIPGT
jgi:hypothetical protein